MLDRDVTSQEEQGIRTFMEGLAHGTPNPSAVPPADVIWLKAHLRRRWQAERRASMPLDVIEPVQVGTLLATAFLLLIWAMPAVMRALTP